jgi:uncharacterized protein (TIGR02246 family)
MRTMIVGLLALAACGTPPASLTEADRTAIREVSDEFTARFTAGDLAGLMELYTEDATFMPPGAPAVEGRAAIQAFMTAFPRVTAMNFDLEEVDGRGDLAFVRGSYRMTMDVPGAPGPVTDSGKFVEIRRKQTDGRWLVDVDIFNSDLPPPAPPAPAETPAATP